MQEENKKKKVEDVRICIKFIPMKSLIKYNGFYYYLGGKSVDKIEIKNAVEFCIDRAHYNYIKKLEKACILQKFDEIDKDGKLILTREQNQKIFSILKEKYETSIYKNQRGAIKGLVIQNQEKFVTLSKEQQSIVLYQILNNLRTSEAADLQLIGGSKNSGKNMISKRINNAEEIILIYQSITGLYKAEVNLLTV